MTSETNPSSDLKTIQASTVDCSTANHPCVSQHAPLEHKTWMTDILTWAAEQGVLAEHDNNHRRLFGCWSGIPSNINDLLQIRHLNLSHSSISYLPESISHLKGLNTINLETTNITDLPESLGQLKALWELNLSNTQITQLPESFHQLKKITKFERKASPPLRSFL